MQYLSKKARAIQPYTAGEQPRDKKYVKLNTTASLLVGLYIILSFPPEL